MSLIRRVLILNYEYPPVGGGAAVATRGLAVELARRGVEVDVVTSAWDARPTRGMDPAPELGSPGIRILRVRCARRGLHDAGLRGGLTYVLFAAPVVRRLLRRHRYDVVHIYFSLPTGLLLPLVRSRRLPSVVSLRGSDVPGYDETNRTLGYLHRLLLPLTRSIWRRASRVVALSSGLGETARGSDPSLQFVVIPNGVDHTIFRPSETPVHQEDGMIRCLSVARLTPRKGHLCLLEALARLPAERYRLDIAGGGELEPELRTAVARLGLGHRVRLHGAVGHADLGHLYRQADLFTLLSEHESFGNAFAEALAAGLPVVATRAGAIPDLVEDGVNGLLVAPGDPAAAAEAIRTLGDDPERRRDMARRNRAKAETQLSWAGVADRYLQVYREAIGARDVEPSSPELLAP